MPGSRPSTKLRARRAKIVATLGPATSSDEQIEKLLEAGADVLRFNFSHGTHEEHGDRIARVRAIARRRGRAVAILQDLQGPKIRTGRLENGQPIELSEGAELTITCRSAVGTQQMVSTTYEALASDVKAGDTLLLDDGKIRLRVLECEGQDILTRVEHGGQLSEHKGINLPGVAVSAPALTEKDRADLAFGLGHGVDWVALSFIRTAAEVRGARELMTSLGRDVPLIVKLEKPEAIDNLDEILAESDGVMVARGDLGVELPVEQVPMIQKTVIRRANRQSKLVITATQMLESMISNPSPTRAEATDVANAIWDGSDAVMLSAESAVGDFPIEAVRTMDRIVTEAEKQAPRHEHHPGRLSHAHAISHAARSLAEDLDIEAIISFTRTGRTARLLSQDRPRVPIVAFTADEAIQRQLAFWWGVLPIACPLPDTTEALVATMVRELLERGICKRGQNVVLVGAIPLRVGVHTNFLKLHRLG